MKYIVLFIVFILLSGCSDIYEGRNLPPAENSIPPAMSSPSPFSDNMESGDIITPETSPDAEEVIPPEEPVGESEDTIPPPEEPVGESEDTIPSPEENAEPETISEASTSIYDDSENRVVNLNLASDAINGTVLEPGEVFSFNDTVGERTSEKGYKSASILINGEHVDGVGGGVCQISTTLYLAADDAGLEIIERHRHNNDKIVYAPEGRDCTVNYDDLDLKFRNNTDNAVKLKVSVGDEKVYAEILNV